MTDTNGSPKQHIFKRSSLWVGGIATAVVTALAVTAATGVATSAWHHFFNKQPPGPQGPPVVVASVNLGNCVHGCGEIGDFVFPHNVIFSPNEVKYLGELLSSLDGINGYGEWMRAHGGVDVGHVDIQLTLVGNWPQGVRIMNMEPVGQCTAPLTGTYSAFAGSGSAPSIPLGFNLDKPGGDARVLPQGYGLL